LAMPHNANRIITNKIRFVKYFFSFFPFLFLFIRFFPFMVAFNFDFCFIGAFTLTQINSYPLFAQGRLYGNITPSYKPFNIYQVVILLEAIFITS